MVSGLSGAVAGGSVSGDAKSRPSSEVCCLDSGRSGDQIDLLNQP